MSMRDPDLSDDSSVEGAPYFYCGPGFNIHPGSTVRCSHRGMKSDARPYELYKQERPTKLPEDHRSAWVRSDATKPSEPSDVYRDGNVPAELPAGFSRGRFPSVDETTSYPGLRGGGGKSKHCHHHRHASSGDINWCPPTDTSSSHLILQVQKLLEENKQLQLQNAYVQKLIDEISSNLAISGNVARTDFEKFSKMVRTNVRWLADELYLLDANQDYTVAATKNPKQKRCKVGRPIGKILKHPDDDFNNQLCSKHARDFPMVKARESNKRDWDPWKCPEPIEG